MPMPFLFLFFYNVAEMFKSEQERKFQKNEVDRVPRGVVDGGGKVWRLKQRLWKRRDCQGTEAPEDKREGGRKGFCTW